MASQELKLLLIIIEEILMLDGEDGMKYFTACFVWA
jgi:hypothetical protein